MNVGDEVPDFELPDQKGETRRLSTMLETGPVVLFFYPAAMTKGCTAEVRHFRDLMGEFREVGAQPVGVSADEVDRQAEFAAQNDVPYPLLSDPERILAKQFSVQRRLGMAPLKRHTFVIGTNRRVLEVIRSELNMEAHADRALEVLRTT
ncbi:peroxiredoxin [Phytoactinopolyspora mesophila]|uniref:thioredoxin-dependent peroxiredoxin n=1 Tax=Phytoactinopolyspora mesophila TaxID=2650750 RepID=A0A7K3MAC5_9ACTN|nr:peroxiredoxin [Phytoactinopolyspora mesophila]NDL60265.1 redoxin domain-containing protein [Phytoactinopolyspora mesophila]